MFSRDSRIYLATFTCLLRSRLFTACVSIVGSVTREWNQVSSSRVKVRAISHFIIFISIFLFSSVTMTFRAFFMLIPHMALAHSTLTSTCERRRLTSMGEVSKSGCPVQVRSRKLRPAPPVLATFTHPSAKNNCRSNPTHQATRPADGPRCVASKPGLLHPPRLRLGPFRLCRHLYSCYPLFPFNTSASTASAIPLAPPLDFFIFRLSPGGRF